MCYKVDIEIMTHVSQCWDTPALVFAIEVH